MPGESRPSAEEEAKSSLGSHRHDHARGIGKEPREIDRGVADADKAARTGSQDESVRNTPPAGSWNDTSGD
jgi:hypothetical protein